MALGKERGTVTLKGRKINYKARVSTFGGEFGVAVEADGDFDTPELADLVNEFVVRKHRELEIAFMESRQK